MADNLGFVAVHNQPSRSDAQQVVNATVTLDWVNDHSIHVQPSHSVQVIVLSTCWHLTPGSNTHTVQSNPLNITSLTITVHLLYKIRYTSTPVYLSRHIRPQESTRHLRFSTTSAATQIDYKNSLRRPRNQCSAPAVWNSLNTDTLCCIAL